MDLKEKLTVKDLFAYAEENKLASVDGSERTFGGLSVTTVHSVKSDLSP